MTPAGMKDQEMHVSDMVFPPSGFAPVRNGSEASSWSVGTSILRLRMWVNRKVTARTVEEMRHAKAMVRWQTAP